MSETSTKRCSNPQCTQPQPLPATAEFFHRHRLRPDGLCTECKQCKSKREKERNKKKRAGSAAPSTIRRDGHCAVCETTYGNIIADIDETTKEIRGYLCSKCFRVLSLFQADPKRIRKVADYLEQAAGRHR